MHICCTTTSNYFAKIVSFLRMQIIFQRHVCATVPVFKVFRSPVKFNKPKISKQNKIQIDEVEDANSDDKDIDILLDRTLLRNNSGHQVFIIQPYIKWGPCKKKNTTPELQLLESVTLVNTLRTWKVVGETTIAVESFTKKAFFGKGNLFMMKELIFKEKSISAVFISVDTLSLLQQITLQQIFGVPVFDRYTIIMHIFREHAVTREAKLQIQLAELPYLWTVLKGIQLGIGEKFGGGAIQIGGFGPKLLDRRKEIFRARESKLKKAILELREYRQTFRKIREKSKIATVAVVGYTNAGKTSVIKALTGKETLDPQNYLFATLDVTCHLGQLPSGLDVYYIDTLGFISDIPTYLMESFIHTLEDVVNADLIIHVRDVSHPDNIAQNDNVIKTLNDLNLSGKELKNIITVGNKIDLLPKSKWESVKTNDMVMISSTELIGIDILRCEIEKQILSTNERNLIVIRVKSGGEEYEWLQKKATVVKESPDQEDNQFIFLNVIISKVALAKFRHQFIKSYQRQ